MPIDKYQVLIQIRKALREYQQARQDYMVGRDVGEPVFAPPTPVAARLITTLRTTIERFAPRPESYLSPLELCPKGQDGYQTEIIESLAGSLQALHNDYEADALLTYRELVHSDLFSDFLEMAEYFLSEGYKEAAAVITGGVLEEHLRKLCDKHQIPTVRVDKKGEQRRLTIEPLNVELAKKGVYGKNDQKQITAWADLRNEAAHGHHTSYDAKKVENMLAGVRHFISINPA